MNISSAVKCFAQLTLNLHMGIWVKPPTIRLHAERNTGQLIFSPHNFRMRPANLTATILPDRGRQTPYPKNTS